MKVCKFGGSSLADASQLNKVIDIVLADPARRIVVVSAPGKRDKGDTKVTDLLIDLAKTALAGENFDRQLGAVVERYALIADELKLGEDIVADITRDLRSRIAQVKDLRPEEFLDLVKAAGEDNNAKLVAVAFAARGRKARYASPKDTGMVLKGEFGDATLDPDSYSTLSRAFSNFEGIVIYPGFFGYTKDGKVATFPRGGSDITGSILAAAVCADVYENFTDVDSVYPVDPRIVPEVKDGIPTMTYREMRELAYAGFGVFADDAVIPAVRARIPINIRNTNHPGEPGTMIQQSRRVVPGTVVGIASADGFCNIVVEKYLMNREIGFGRKLLQILEDEHVPYEHMPSGVDSQCIVIKEQYLPKEVERRVVSTIRRVLEPDFVTVERDITTLMVVGEGMCYTPGMLAKACLALASAGISLSMVNQGSSEVSFMIAVRKQDRDNAVRSLYKAFFG
ncbi:MAG: aspartate kinase [Kiritimatiellae bacterium]|nr:aspartate kinase [Kiritimatiellia bacterium]MBR0241173.1 aspartate kinase [Kiritimatiellia bacterium]